MIFTNFNLMKFWFDSSDDEPQINLWNVFRSYPQIDDHLIVGRSVGDLRWYVTKYQLGQFSTALLSASTTAAARKTIQSEHRAK